MPDQSQVRALSLAAALCVATFASPNAHAETWPTLADYVVDMELIVVATVASIDDDVVQLAVDETWLGAFDATYMVRPFGDTGFEATLDEHGLTGIAVGDQAVFFFDQVNDGMFGAHSTSFVVRDGSVVYAETSDFDAVTYTIAQFADQVRYAPVRAQIDSMDFSVATNPDRTRTFIGTIFGVLIQHDWQGFLAYCDPENARAQLSGMTVRQYVAEIFSSGNTFRSDGFLSMDDIVHFSGLQFAQDPFFTYVITGTVHLRDGRTTPLELRLDEHADGQLLVNGSVG